MDGSERSNDVSAYRARAYGRGAPGPGAPRRSRRRGNRGTRMNAADISGRAEFARQIAREAGVLAMRYFRHEIDFEAQTKGPQDFVSTADHAVEALLRDRLQRAFASDAILGEEAGGELGRNLWVIDPIDGTINFVHGVRYWCISIAFIAAGERRIGVVYDPTQ